MTEYNEYIRDNEFIESFIPCARSIYRKKCNIFFEHNTRKCGHLILEQCKNRHDGYFTCITFKDDVFCEKRHICNFFPVMIGSDLDHMIYKNLYPNAYFVDNPAFNDLFGMIYVDGSLCYFSYLLTNRTELVHHIKPNGSNSIYCLYIYDLQGRGHKLTIMGDGRIIYRNQSGQDANYMIGESFKFDGDFIIDEKHLDLAHIYPGFMRIFNHTIDIDSLENKITLSPVNILHRAVQMARRDFKMARSFLTRGEIEKFASQKISYAEQKSKNAQTSTRFLKGGVKCVNDSKIGGCAKKRAQSSVRKPGSSFNYKKIQPNQILIMGNTWDRNVVRPIPKNVSKSSIPKNTEFFLCLAEKSMSIDSPNRWLLLLPNVVVSNASVIGRGTDMNLLFEKMLAMGIIYDRCGGPIDDKDKPILVSGGITTRYNLRKSGLDYDTIRYIKGENAFMEIFDTDTFTVFNLSIGIPFIPIKLSGSEEYIMSSPLELSSTFKDEREQLYNKIFGVNCCDELQRMAEYITLNKFMVSVNYFKNRFSDIDSIKYFELTNENICAYVNHIASRGNKRPLKYNSSDSTLNLDILFSSHPQITGDSYILNRNLSINTTIIQRCRFEFDFTKDVNLCFVKSPSPRDCMCERDSSGNLIRKYICVAKIFKMGSPLGFHIFPQIKLMMRCKRVSYGHEYSLFKYFDEKCFLNRDDFHLSICATFSNKYKKMYIDIITNIDIDYYDGIKLSDCCGQKGLTSRQEVDKRFSGICERGTKEGIRPDVVGSIFSIIGRAPLIELKSVYKNKIDTDHDVLFGTHKFALLKNITSVMRSYSQIRLDLYSAKIMTTNNSPRALYSIAQQGLAKHERGNVLPEENLRAMGILSITKANIDFFDRFGNTRNVSHLMTDEDYDEILNLHTNKKQKV